MSSAPSLYRRHRPRTFADVVGQEHVVRTLSHAVQQDQIHHAYLFVGSRGTGKTSMAKILAACLNCVNGPTVTPCGVCDSCVSIANATSLDVIEMDAASNNSVDDIRELRDKVAYAPVSGRHKVYILDEAHMLSTQAWNAFLKTLEEPPPRTVFVLATTEARKVLPTVVDRCHRFDFGRPSAEQVAEVLRRVSVAESIDIDPGAMALIARSATGSFRDALGTLEQLLTYSGGARIEAADVLAVLGVADLDQLAAAVDAVIEGDAAGALRTAVALSAAGRDPAQILRDLESHVDDLLTVQILGEVPEQVRVTPDRDAALLAQAERITPADATRLLELVVGALGACAAGAQARIQLELALVKAAAPEVDPSMSALMSRLARLERGGVSAGGVTLRKPAPAPSATEREETPAADVADALSATSAPAPTATGGLATPGTGDVTATDSTRLAVSDDADAVVEDSAPASSETDADDVAPAPARAASPPPAASTPVEAAAVPNASSDDDYWQDFDASPWPEGDEPAATAADPASTPAATNATATGGAGAVVSDSAPAPTAADATPAPPVSQSAPGTDFDLAQLRSVWRAVVDRVRSSNPMLAVLLAGAEPHSLTGNELALAWPAANDFYRRKAERDENRRVTVDAIRDLTGTTFALRYMLAEADKSPTSATAAPAPVSAPVTLSEDEVVQRFVDDFGASEIPDPNEQDR